MKHFQKYIALQNSLAAFPSKLRMTNLQLLSFLTDRKSTALRQTLDIFERKYCISNNILIEITFIHLMRDNLLIN